jgi:nitrogen fixation-related uncharacterized protein
MHQETFWEFLTDITLYDFLIGVAKGVVFTVIICLFIWGVNIYMKNKNHDDDEWDDFFNSTNEY